MAEMKVTVKTKVDLTIENKDGQPPILVTSPVVVEGEVEVTQVGAVLFRMAERVPGVTGPINFVDRDVRPFLSEEGKQLVEEAFRRAVRRALCCPLDG